MPGITGILHASPDPSLGDTTTKMVRLMVHEPSSVVGQAAFPEFRAFLGWVSRPGTYSDGGPFWNADRTVGLIFSGEEFTPRAPIAGATSDGNAAEIVRLYEEKGAACIAELNGWFSGVLVDLPARKLILFNDRYGLGRIYFHESPQGFLFSSEAKSLLAVDPGAREIDQRGLAEFYSVGCVLQNRTLFKDIALLPPASRWTFHGDGRVERHTYFRAEEWEAQEPLDEVTYVERLKEVFRRIAPRYLRGPAAAAMSLTGGLDSRMLLSAVDAAPGALPCYTFGGPYRDCEDLRIARRLAKLARQPHTTIPIGDDFFPAFPELAEQTVYLSDGTMDVSGAVEIYANKRAREIAPVRLTGNYGSEILRSNVAFRPARLDRSIFTPEFCERLDEAEDTYRKEAAGHRLSFIAFKQVPWHHYGRLSIEQSQLTVRSPFLDNELVALAYRAPRNLAQSPQPALEVTAAGNSGMREIPTDRGLTLRRPSLFRRLITAWHEFTAKAEYAYDYGMPQRLARVDHSLAPLHLERLFLGRHKFYHFRTWYKRQLKGFLLAQAELGEPACYRPGTGGKLIRDHLMGRANRTLELHKLLSVSYIQRLLLKSAWAI